MTIKRYKVIWATPINVEQIKRDVNEVFEANHKSKEIIKLIKNKYIAEVE